MILNVTDANAANHTCDVPTFIKPTTDASTTPLFTIPLSTLIPMMKARQLPLFAIKEHVYIEINFNKQLVAGGIGTILCAPDGFGGSPADCHR